ncbi:MAG: hydrogen peroxide-inducible genes activator [Parvularculaceae bacterium]|nr:hydrogen peroxide-inducible genes activator [Parvularculaceae bacterium]
MPRKVSPTDQRSVTLRQLRYLAAVAEQLHFRRAAESCGVSQPSLSAQIQELEETLDLRLFERGRSGVALTPAGREISARARRILDEAQALVDFAAGAQGGLVGVIRLGASPTLGPYLLPHVVARLHRQHKDLSLYVREAAPRDLEHELADGTHDVILAQIPVAGAELYTARLFREPLYLALAEDHPLAADDAVDPQDLAGMTILSLSPRFQLHEQVDALCREFRATLSREYEGTSLDAVRQMVGMGMGAAFVPALYARSEIRLRGEVAVRPIRGKTITRSIGLVWRRSAGSAPAYRKMTDIIRDICTKKFPELTIDASAS